MDQAWDGLREAERRRERAAERLRVPVGYLVVFGVGVAAVAVGAVLGSRPALAEAGFYVAVAGVLVTSCGPSLLRRYRGVGVPETRGVRYPSGRRNWAVFATLFVPLFAAAIGLAYAAHLFVPAVVCGVLAGVGAAVGLGLMYRNMIHELRHGLVGPS